jgi:hypothetical protein
MNRPSAASISRAPAAIPPGRDEPSEEEYERTEQERGNQGIGAPGYFRNAEVDIAGRSSIPLELYVPTHEEDQGQNSQAQPDYQEEQMQKRLEHQAPPPSCGRLMPVGERGERM